MAINMKNIVIDGCYTGISTHKDADLNVDGLEIKNTKNAIVVRDPRDLLHSLGLPRDTPPDHLIEAVRILVAAKTDSPAVRNEKLRESKLVTWLGAVADLAGLAEMLLSPQAQTVVSSLVAGAMR